MTLRVRAYECWPVWAPQWARTINSISAGRARAEYWSSLCESYPDTPYTDVRSRVAGAPQANDDFARTARYRGVEDVARVGGRVKVGDDEGLIVGSNASANFDVLFVTGPHRGQKVNCHPNWKMEFLGIGKRGTG